MGVYLVEGLQTEDAVEDLAGCHPDKVRQPHVGAVQAPDGINSSMARQRAVRTLRPQISSWRLARWQRDTSALCRRTPARASVGNVAINRPGNFGGELEGFGPRTVLSDAIGWSARGEDCTPYRDLISETAMRVGLGSMINSLADVPDAYSDPTFSDPRLLSRLWPRFLPPPRKELHRLPCVSQAATATKTCFFLSITDIPHLRGIPHYPTVSADAYSRRRISKPADSLYPRRIRPIAQAHHGGPAPEAKGFELNRCDNRRFANSVGQGVIDT